MLAVRGTGRRSTRFGRTGSAARTSIDRERGEQHCGDHEQRDRLRRRPADLGGPRQRVHQHHEAARHGDGSRDVEAATCEGARGLPGSRNGVRPTRTAPIGTFTKKIHSQPKRAGEDSSEQRPRRRAAARDPAPDAQGEVTLATLGERRGEDGQRGRRQQGAAEALERRETRSATPPTRPGRTRARLREDGQAGHEDPAAAEPVGEAAAEQQEAAEQDRVGSE